MVSYGLQNVNASTSLSFSDNTNEEDTYNLINIYRHGLGLTNNNKVMQPATNEPLKKERKQTKQKKLKTAITTNIVDGSR